MSRSVTSLNITWRSSQGRIEDVVARESETETFHFVLRNFFFCILSTSKPEILSCLIPGEGQPKKTIAEDVISALLRPFSFSHTFAMWLFVVITILLCLRTYWPLLKWRNRPPGNNVFRLAC